MLIHHIVLALSVMFFSEFGDDYPIVKQHIDTISIVHLEDDINFIFFFDTVQGEWVILDYRWQPDYIVFTYIDKNFGLFWRDDSDSCWRYVTSSHWIESWELESPLVEQNNRPWFARLLTCGLKKPPEKKEK